MIVGNIRSSTARRPIRQWAALHRLELEVNWKNMEAGRHLERIEPLERSVYELSAIRDTG